MEYYRDKMPEVMNLWKGATTGSNMHKTILAIYNSYLPHPRGHVAVVNDAWCAITVSAASIALNYTDIIPVECGCGQLIDLFKQKGEWVENDAFVPQQGDIVFYYWDAKATGDTTEHASHVGVVEKCDGKYIWAIEGNYNGKVAERKFPVDWQYIRGFATPKYTKNSSSTSVSSTTTEAPEELFYTVKKGDNLSLIAKKYNTSYINIARLNGIKFPFIIHPGDRLRVR